MLKFFRFRTHSRGTEVDAIKNEFDEEFYRNNFISEHEVVDNLPRHYLEIGWYQGHDPCPWFSTSHYLRMYSDVAAAGINPFVHYIIDGRKEKRKILPSDIIIRSENISAVIKSQYDVVVDDFDVEFYRTRNHDLTALTDVQLINHYNEFGWKEHRDPCAWFSTAYYLNRYKDISGANLNPFCHYIAHGKAEGRLPNYYSRIKQVNASPLRVSAIIPNYNHAQFLDERIASIVNQDLPVHELIILDDASSDDSRRIISELAAKLDISVKTVFNEKNSGNVFRQWEKGVSLATGEIIWICESDDFCDENFLSVLVPYFNDPSVMIAFGAIQFCKADGSFLPGLDSYRESAEPGVWAQPRVEAAANWFGKAFGLRNVIANVGGCLIRRQEIEPSIWAGAQSYKVCGDWYLYVHLSRGGRIAFDPAAIAFFRQHQSNTSVSSFKKRFFL